MKKIVVLLIVLLSFVSLGLYAGGEDLKSLDKVLWQVIYFDTGSAELSSDANIIINESVNFLKANPAYTLYVAGHTDTKGSEKLNEDLSLHRAEAVRNAILAAGISPNRVGMGYYAYSVPAIPDAQSESDKAKNRRVEIYKKLSSGAVVYDNTLGPEQSGQTGYTAPETNVVPNTAENTNIQNVSTEDSDVVIIDEDKEEPQVVDSAKQADDLQDYKIPLKNDDVSPATVNCKKKTYFGDWKNEPCASGTSSGKKNYNSTSTIGTE